MGALNLRYSLFLSVMLHVILIVLWCCFPDTQLTFKDSSKTLWIEVASIKKMPQPESDPKKRVVQTSPNNLTEKAAPSSFLGEHTQQVDQQTVNRERTVSIGSSPKSVPHKSLSEETATPNLNRLGIPLFSSNSKPIMDEPEWATPGTRPQDYIEGMKQSDRTALNTKEYVFYGYFQRIRSRLDQAWVPILKERLVRYYRSGRRLASDLDHTTKVLVVLNEQGEIVRVKLVSESGTHDLDDAAVSAFNRAGPFPNPPKGMIDSNRQVQIPWDFILKT